MAKSNDFHERLEETSETKRSSDRSFGIVFFVLFLAIAAYLWWINSSAAIYVAAVGVAFGVIALVAPRILAPLNWVWTQFGLLLHRLISPIIITLLFLVAVTPIGLLMRLFGKRPLNLKYDPKAESYWIERKPAGPAPGTLNRQF